MTRIGHLVLSGFLIATANTFGSSLAAAQFLSSQGGQGIATYYIVFALVSIPAWAIYSRFIDRGSRAALLQRYLLVMALATALLIAISYQGGVIAVYALYVGISMLEQLLFSLYMVMLTDYLTAREMTRYSTRVTVSLSAGAMVGGLLAGVLADRIILFWLLFGMPFMLMGCFAHLVWLARRWRPAGEWAAMGEGSVRDSLLGIGRILRRVGIAALLSVAVFLNIATQCVSEYMVFGIYAKEFPDEQALASFFGLMSGALNLAAVLIGLGLTGPLMRRLGVARMNLFFPVSLAISFIVMLASPVLVVAMFAHVVYDGFSNNVDAPVMAVNYNAVPARFVGQIRVFNDSLIYPIALAASGLVILLVDAQTGFFGVGVLGFLLSAVFVSVGWALGRRYMSGLIGILKEGTVDLARASFMANEAPKVVLRQQTALDAMLRSDDPTTADFALRIVANANIAPFRDALVRRLMTAGDQAVTVLARAGDRHAETLRALWPEADAPLRMRIAQYLTAVGRDLPADLEASPISAALALAGESRHSPESVQRLSDLASASQEIAEALLPVLAARHDMAAVPVLIAIARTQPGLEDAAIRAIADVPIASASGLSLPDALIEAAIESKFASRRAIGYRLAALGQWPVGKLAEGLSDRDAQVRQSAIAALNGQAGVVAVLSEKLSDESAPTRLAAIDCLGREGATEVLFDYLQSRAFPRIAAYRVLRKWLPRESTTWIEIARLAMAEADHQAVEEVLQTLAALGHDETVRYIRRFMGASDGRMRARATEAISAFDERKLVTPLLPLLDEATIGATKQLPLTSIVAQMKASPSPWMRRAAILAESEGTQMSSDELGLLDRLLFLRKVPVFESCSLDDLYAIHLVLTSVKFRDGEIIMKEGDQGEQLFVLLEGNAKVGSTAASRFVEFARLNPGAAFGEMALFGDGIRTADVIAIGNVRCLVLERSHFEDLTRQQPGILVQICRLFGSRLRAANKGNDALQASEQTG